MGLAQGTRTQNPPESVRSNVSWPGPRVGASPSPARGRVGADMGHVFRRYKVAFESVGRPDLVDIRFDPVDERGVGLFVQVDRATRLLFGNDEELTSAEILDRLDKAEAYSPAEEGLADLLRRREELFRLRWAEDEAWDELHWLAS